MTRKYFRLMFNNKYVRVVGARSSLMDSIQNLRDLGGYRAAGGKSVKWGKVFRSGRLSHLSPRDRDRLDGLGIKTILDLRTPAERQAEPIRHEHARVVSIPIMIGDALADAPRRIAEDTMRKGDAVVYMEDSYLQFITDNTAAVAQALSQFLDKDNYPILITCAYGKDRTGFFSAILLAALGVSCEEIQLDYLISNQYIQTWNLADVVRHLSTDAQESITVLLSANEHFLDLAFDKIRKDYGSTRYYLASGLGLTEEKQGKLKDLLLY